MHAVNLISQGLCADDPDLPEQPGGAEPGICAITGEHDAYTYPRKLLLGKSFTDGALLRAPQSDRVSSAAYTALKYKWERMSSWRAGVDGFERLDRAGVRKRVFSPPKSGRWSGYATTSYKKHGALRAPVNSGGSNIWLFETRIVNGNDAERVGEWWGKLNAALRLGIGRSVLETLDCPQPVMRLVGLAAWLEFEAWARDKHKSGLYAFLCYLLPSQEELKRERSDK